ncbi:MAG TPA: hypothetical protein VE685_01570 [Thermoanaerobaculia bacterium]|nr:hypothetical protein [Thermoanaerobaculia bacterium]
MKRWRFSPISLIAALLLLAGAPVSQASTPPSGQIFSADGTIRVVDPRSAFGDPAPGAAISSFLTRVRVELGPAGALTPDNAPDSLAGGGLYRLVGSENCTSGE